MRTVASTTGMKTHKPRPHPDAACSAAPSTSLPRQARQAPTPTSALARSPRMAAQRQTLRAAFGPAAEPAQWQGDASQRRLDEMPAAAVADKPQQDGLLAHEPWHVVPQTPGGARATAQRAGTAPREVLQRAPFVVHPKTFKQVDLGDAGLSLDDVAALYEATPYHMQDQYAQEFRQAMMARGGVPKRFPELRHALAADAKADAKAGSVAESAGRKIIAATNALKAGGGSSTDQETKPLVTDAKRDERVGASAAKDLATTAIGSAVSIATGGISGKVQSAVSVLASGAKIVQINDILARAESQYRETKNSSQSEPLTQLIPALKAVATSKWLETLGKGVGAVVPGAGSVASAAAKSPEDLQTIAILAGDKKNALAIEAAKVLGLGAMGDAKTTYGSTASAHQP